MNIKREMVVSIAFGFIAALIVGRIGPAYATPLIIVALPVVFLTASRAATGSTITPDWEWLLLAFGVTWLPVSLVSPIVQGSPEALPFWLALGVVPVLVAMTLAVRRRLFPSSDIARR